MGETADEIVIDRCDGERWEEGEEEQKREKEL